MSEAHGDFASPGWPRNYSHHEMCVWNISVPINKVLDNYSILVPHYIISVPHYLTAQEQPHNSIDSHHFATGHPIKVHAPAAGSDVTEQRV